MDKQRTNLKKRIGKRIKVFSEWLIGGEKEDNDYYTRYKYCIQERVYLEESPEREAFLVYLDNTYHYIQKKRKELQEKYFQSGKLVLRLGLFVTVINAILTIINVFIAPEKPLEMIKNLVPILKVASPMITGFMTCVVGYMTYKQAMYAKMKYHETWIRHTSHYLCFNEECRDFAISLHDYKGLSAEKSIQLFIERIYKLEDMDYRTFLKNVQKIEE